MQYNLTQDELQAVQAKLDDLPASPMSLDDPVMTLPTSSWGDYHLKALRVVSIDDLPLSRFFDADFIPKDDHPAFKYLAPQIVVPSADDLRTLTGAKARGWRPNDMLDFFKRLSDSMITRPFNAPGTADRQRNPSPESEISAFSEEDDEIPSKQTSRKCIGSLLQTILIEPMAEFNSDIGFGWDAIDIKSFIHIGSNGRAKALSDGAIVLRGHGALGKHPMVNVEAKRRHAGGLNHEIAESDQYAPRILAQEVGGMLGQATVHCKWAYGRKQWQEQDAWTIATHGTKIRLVTARFSASYLSCVNSLSMPLNEEVVVFRSAPADLKTKKGRIAALRYIMALLEYLKSGAAKMAILEAVLESLRG